MTAATHLSVYRNLAKTGKQRNMIKHQWGDHDFYKSELVTASLNKYSHSTIKVNCSNEHGFFKTAM